MVLDLGTPFSLEFPASAIADALRPGAFNLVPDSARAVFQLSNKAWQNCLGNVAESARCFPPCQPTVPFFLVTFLWYSWTIRVNEWKWMENGVVNGFDRIFMDWIGLDWIAIRTYLGLRKPHDSGQESFFCFRFRCRFRNLLLNLALSSAFIVRFKDRMLLHKFHTFLMPFTTFYCRSFYKLMDHMKQSLQKKGQPMAIPINACWRTLFEHYSKIEYTMAFCRKNNYTHWHALTL